MSTNEQLHHQQETVNTGMASTYDSKFMGPRKKRNCTDISFLIIFAIALIAWLSMGFWVIFKSDFIARVFDDKSQPFINGKWISTEENHLVLAKAFNVFMLPVFLALVIAMVTAFVMMLLMRWLSVELAWVFAGIIHVLTLAIATLHLTVRHNIIHVVIGEFGIIICFVIIVLYKSRLKYTVALIKESSRAIFSMWSTLLIPIISALFKLAVLEFFTVVLYSIWSLKEIKSDNDTRLNFLYTFNIIACAWTLLFISALSEISLGHAYATWYWTSIKSRIPFFVTALSAMRSIWYHSGTAAFGALFITACRWICVITSSRILCISTSVNDFLKRFNGNVYVMCAIHGNGVRSSSLAVSQLYSRSRLQRLPTTTITGKILEICKILLAFTTTSLALSYLGKFYVVLPTYPILFLIVGAYSIVNDFFVVYAIAVDTLVLCALDDAEKNGGLVNIQ